MAGNNNGNVSKQNTANKKNTLLFINGSPLGKYESSQRRDYGIKNCDWDTTNEKWGCKNEIFAGDKASERGHHTFEVKTRQRVLLLKRRGEIILPMKEVGFIICLICLSLFFCCCAAPGQIATSTPQQQPNTYPAFIEDTPATQQAARDAWKKFLAELNLPDAKADLMPVLNSPRALPPELAGQIKLKTVPGNFGEVEAKEALRRFIEQAGSVLCASPIKLQDLSLVSFADEGNFYRAVFWQANYSYRIAENYGELRFVIGKNGELLQWNSSLLPIVSLPTRAEIKPQAIYEKMLGRQFSYTTIAGVRQSYKASKRADINLGDLIVYPKLEGNRLEIHLAYLVVVGSGTTWTVFIDAITGEELGVKQNFAS